MIFRIVLKHYSEVRIMAKRLVDSGVEWIGAIPDDWEIHRFKICIKSRESGAWGEEPKGIEGDEICLRIADFDYSKYRFKDVELDQLTQRHYTQQIIDKLLLKKGDIIIEKSGGGDKTPVGRTIIFDKDYRALFANFCDRLRCAEFVNSQFMQLVFAVFYDNRYVWNYIKQTTGLLYIIPYISIVIKNSKN